MIALVQDFDLGDQGALAAALAAALPGSAAALAGGAEDPEAPADHGPLESWVLQQREQGAGELALIRQFRDATRLGDLRRRLSAHDNEIYAFRFELPEAIWAARLGLQPELKPALHAWRSQIRRDARHLDAGVPLALPEWRIEQVAAAVVEDIHAPVELVEPDPRWPQQFAQERAELARVLGARIQRIEHIGSTAVPELPAKPILDIQIELTGLDAAAACVEPLAALGYVFVDYPQNRDRRFFRKGRPRSHHLHLVVAGSPKARDMLTFRDALRADPGLRDRYRDLKLGAAVSLGSQRAAYGEQKTALVREVLERARPGTAD